MKTLTSILVLLFGLQAATAQPLQRVAPEQAGLDSRKLMYADEAIETAIAGKEIPGAVLAVVRNGKMAYLKAYGNKRIYPDTEPMTVNTVFDMASCSKSISTAVCTMILAERGKIRLLDPVSRYIPDFKDWESEDGNPHSRFADTQFRTPALCLGCGAGTEIRFSQPGRADGVHRRMQTRFQAANRLSVQLPKLHNPATHHRGRQRTILARLCP